MNEIPEEKIWQYLTDEEIEKLEDAKIKSEYRRRIGKIVKFVINPLYMYALKHGFDDATFIKQKTIHGYVEELKPFFESKEIDRSGRVKIILESRKRL